MKIAVACEGKMVTEHFGHCEGYRIFKVDDKEIKGEELIPNPGHQPGFLPLFLKEKEVDVIISGGMGGRAINLFNEAGIEVITGAAGGAEAVVKSYIEGKLKSTGSVCNEHRHAGECGH